MSPHEILALAHVQDLESCHMTSIYNAILLQFPDSKPCDTIDKLVTLGMLHIGGDDYDTFTLTDHGIRVLEKCHVVHE